MRPTIIGCAPGAAIESDHPCPILGRTKWRSSRVAPHHSTTVMLRERASPRPDGAKSGKLDKVAGQMLRDRVLKLLSAGRGKRKDSVPTRRASGPENMRIYAIGDIHGRADLLERVLQRIDWTLAEYPTPRAIEVFLGDYIDRGPDSRTVVDMLVERSRGHETVFLKGNHEVFLLAFLHDPLQLGVWQRFGGLETLISFGQVPPINPSAEAAEELAASLADALTASQRAFLAGLRPSFTCGDFFFAHAGVRPGVPLAEQREADLLWIRDEFLNDESDFGKIVVHGHTPVAKPEYRHNRINIDTGAYATGRLTCLMIEGDGAFLL
jgi:serine/threonine protein phosphatase 1